MIDDQHAPMLIHPKGGDLKCRIHQFLVPNEAAIPMARSPDLTG
jgi:hypothetical protein